MRIRLKPAITISNDEEGKYRLFAPDEILVERWIDTWAKQFSGIAAVAALGTESLNLGDIAATKGLWLSASGDCQLKINGATPALQLRKATVAGGADRAGVMLEADITSLEVTAGSDAVDIIYAVWGDTAP